MPCAVTARMTNNQPLPQPPPATPNPWRASPPITEKGNNHDANPNPHNPGTPVHGKPPTPGTCRCKQASLRTQDFHLLPGEPHLVAPRPRPYRYRRVYPTPAAPPPACDATAMRGRRRRVRRHPGRNLFRGNCARQYARNPAPPHAPTSPQTKSNQPPPCQTCKAGQVTPPHTTTHPTNP